MTVPGYKFDRRFGKLRLSVRQLRGRRYALVEPARGSFPRQDLVDFQEFLLTSPCVRADIGTIWDLRAHDFDHAGFTEVCAIVAASKLEARKHADRALLVSGDVGFGMSRMFQQMADSRNVIDENRVHVTKSLRRAISWVTATEGCTLGVWDGIGSGPRQPRTIPALR